ncbi:MAG: gliding motility lipoprotein GldH [Tannerellaceae bacterium]|jgi:gliding motility-associated lipoprotein GldH|nr:gliding motility lipoprotein GldH [Tannerellaceae bacterium]
MRARARRQGRQANKLCLCLLFLAFVSSSCRDNVIYHQYQSIDGGVWEKDRAHNFTFVIDDEKLLYDISFEVRNNGLYPYQNLWIFSTAVTPLGEVSRDTVEIILADDFGKWKGRGLSLYQSTYTLSPAHKFPTKGRYTITFTHAMRRNAIEGIQEIGLKITRSRPQAVFIEIPFINGR